MSVSEEIRLLIHLVFSIQRGTQRPVVLETQSYPCLLNKKILQRRFAKQRRQTFGLLTTVVTPLSSVGIRPPATAYLQKIAKGPVYQGLMSHTGSLACRERTIFLGVIEILADLAFRSMRLITARGIMFG